MAKKGTYRTIKIVPDRYYVSRRGGWSRHVGCAYAEHVATLADVDPPEVSSDLSYTCSLSPAMSTDDGGGYEAQIAGSLGLDVTAAGRCAQVEKYRLWLGYRSDAGLVGRSLCSFCCSFV